MTPEEQLVIKRNLEQVASILYKNTTAEELEDFETVELTIRKQILAHVAPNIGNFF